MSNKLESSEFASKKDFNKRVTKLDVRIRVLSLTTWKLSHKQNKPAKLGLGSNTLRVEMLIREIINPFQRHLERF